MEYINGKQYKKLEIDFPISKELNDAINTFMHHINDESGTSEDCYRDIIEFWLKDSHGKLTENQYQMLKDYYVLGGIYSSNG